MSKKNFTATLDKTVKESDSYIKSNLKVDADFSEFIPALEEEQLKQLEENILKEGIRDPLIVWKEENILIDGHNRYQIAQKYNLNFDISTISFPSREDVYVWMINNQLGRRNLNKEQLSYFRGLRYEKQKAQGKRIDLTSPLNEERLATAEKLAKEYRVGRATIERDAQFAKGLDLIGAENPELKRNILSGKVKVNKNQIQSLYKATSFPKIETAIEIKTLLQKPITEKQKSELDSKKEQLIKLLQNKKDTEENKAQIRSLCSEIIFALSKK